jgi:DNA repair protein RecN (Recombination protein N)
MLTRLYISNYALIDEIDIEWSDGLTIITGETGAGKSIIIGALSLILGERAETEAIRDKEKKTIVEATFDLKGFDLKTFFEENDIDYNENECIARREIGANGRSRTFVNDSPVSVSTLKELMTRVIDIHSQHSNMLLAKPSFQLSILDNIANDKVLIAEYKTKYYSYKELERKLKILKESFSKSKAEEDYIKFQLEQFNELKLHEDEDKELEALQNKLSNVTETKESLWSVENTLNNEENSLIEQLTAIAQKLAETEKHLDEIGGMSDRVKSAIIELKDIAMSVTSIEEGLNDDPKELDRINDRLDKIYSLERKHNVDTVNEIIEIQRNFEAKLNDIDNSEESINAVEKEMNAVHAEATKLGKELSRVRIASAQSFVKELKALARTLGMKNLEFGIEFNEVDLNASGADDVEFKFAFNKNQQLMPVKNTASGGEISRLMLCIKSIIARSMNLPTIIFDEVDTGVSGEIANRIGEMMGDIAKRIQVIAITHLPQVAVHGKTHLRVFKTDTDKETLTSIERLNEDERVIEIAKMLSGKDVNKAAIENAKELMKGGR